MRNFVILFLTCVIYSCVGNFGKKEEFSEFKKDTFFSKGNQIVFLTPNRFFFEKRLKNEEGIHKVDSDFGFYSKKVHDEINNNFKAILSATYSSTRFLGVINKNDTIFIDRYKDSLFYGTLFNFKNKTYKIDRDVFTDRDFWNDFNLPEIKNDSIKLPFNVEF